MDSDTSNPTAGGGAATALAERPTGSEPQRKAQSLFEPAIVRRALGDSFRKLHPRKEARNPIMFVVLVGAVWTTVLFFWHLHDATAAKSFFGGAVAFWLWATVLFANFAEAVAEGRGKAQADALRKTRSETVAHVRQPDGSEVDRASSALEIGDLCVCRPGDVIPGDGDVVEGIASVDESAITGESAPVVRESGGDRSAVTGGTTVLSDEIVVQISTRPGESFIDRMIALVEGADRQKTPNEIALNILLAGLTIVFILAVATLQPFAIYSHAHQSIIVLVGLLVCLAPTTIGGLLSAIGIAGMDRLVQRNVLAMSGRAVEAAGDVSTLLLDKTGTITYGNRMAADFLPVGTVTDAQLAEIALLSSLADETPEGRSIVTLAEDDYGVASRDMVGATLDPLHGPDPHVGRGLGGPVDPQGRRRLGPAVGPRPGWHGARRSRPHRRGHRLERGHAARGRRRPRRAGGDPPQGHGEARHRREVRGDAGARHPHGDDHRRQPAHRRRHRQGGRRRRLRRRGHARGQDGPDQGRAAG